MALPFFKKGKDKPSDPAPRAAAAPAAADPLLDEPLGPDTGSGIVVEDTTGAPQSPLDEAAILYASGQNEAAEQALKGSVAAGNRRAWHMLFDLYAVQNREKELEQLSLAYAMRFETSPPVRQPLAQAASGKAKSGQTASVELPGLLDKNAAAALKAEIAKAAKNDVVRIDFSHIEMVDEPGAEACVQVLAAARKARVKLRLSGVDRLIALLQDLLRATHSRAVHWLLLLELHQTLGQQENFENLAVDYAVHFEVSPPSWSEVEAAEVVQAAPAEADDALRLAGEIVPGNEIALQQFSSHAATHDPVLVDLSQVTRIDYASVGQFISVLMQGLGTGKTVTLRGQNALIQELFRVMGIDQLAQLIPHHPD